MFNIKTFGDKIQIPESADVVFVSDAFTEDYVGGAELTTEALIESSPFETFKLHAKNVNMEPRQAHGEVNIGGMKVKVLGESSSDFKFKIKNKR